MFQFTIRDGLFVLVIVGLSLAWWMDHSRMKVAIERLESQVFELQAEKLDLSIRNALAKSTPRGEKRIRELSESAKKSPLSREESEEVLFLVKHDPDMRIRVQAMAVLPHLRERDEAIEVLRSALRERGESSADGVIPTYAAKYLAHMRATSAIPDVEGWLNYLREEQPYDSDVQPVLVENAERNLAELRAITESPCRQ